MHIWDVKINAPDDQGLCQIEVSFSLEDHPPYQTALPPDAIRAFREGKAKGLIRGDLTTLDNASILNAAADREAGQFLGQTLLETLLRDRGRNRNYAERLIAALKQERSEGSRVWLRLDLTDAGPLSELPWEMIYAGDGRIREFLATSESFGLSRYRKPLGLPPPAPATRPLKILLVVADPTGLLKTDAEVANVRAALEKIGGDQVTLLDPPLLGATRRAFAARVNTDRPHVVHFIGHGSFDGTTGRLHFHKEGDPAATDHVDAQGLSTIIKNDRPWLIFLNACEGAVDGSATRFGGLAQELLGIGVPFVIAMRRAISDNAARDFATSFYRDFTQMPLSQAVARARNLLLASDDTSYEFTTPALYSSLSASEEEDGDRIALAEPISLPPVVPATPEKEPPGGLGKAAIVGTVVALGLVLAAVAGVMLGRSTLPEDKMSTSAPLDGDQAGSDAAASARADPDDIDEGDDRSADVEQPGTGRHPDHRRPRAPRAPAGIGDPEWEAGIDHGEPDAPAPPPPPPPPPPPLPTPAPMPRLFQNLPPLWSASAAGVWAAPGVAMPCFGYRAVYEAVPPQVQRSETQWQPLQATAQQWRACRRWSAVVTAKPGLTADEPLAASAAARLAARRAALDLAASGVPASQIEEQVAPQELDGSPAMTGISLSGRLVPTDRPMTPIEWQSRVAGGANLDRLPRNRARGWADAARLGGFITRLATWNYDPAAEDLRLRETQRVSDAFVRQEVPGSLAPPPAGQAETPEPGAPAPLRLPLIEVRFDFPGTGPGMVSWTPGQDALGDAGAQTLLAFAATASRAHEAGLLQGDWRVLVEAASARGETPFERLQDGLLAASEVQALLEDTGLPAERVVTLSCGSVRPSALPIGSNRSAWLSILPDGIAAPDAACGWDRASSLMPPPVLPVPAPPVSDQPARPPEP